MKRYIFLAIAALMALASWAQTTQTVDRAVIRQGFYLRDAWVDSIQRDTSFLGRLRSVPTAEAVRKFVEGRLKSGFADSITSLSDTALKVQHTTGKQSVVVYEVEGGVAGPRIPALPPGTYNFTTLHVNNEGYIDQISTGGYNPYLSTERYFGSQSIAPGYLQYFTGRAGIKITAEAPDFDEAIFSNNVYEEYNEFTGSNFFGANPFNVIMLPVPDNTAGTLYVSMIATRTNGDYLHGVKECFFTKRSGVLTVVSTRTIQTDVTNAGMNGSVWGFAASPENNLAVTAQSNNALAGAWKVVYKLDYKTF